MPPKPGLSGFGGVGREVGRGQTPRPARLCGGARRRPLQNSQRVLLAMPRTAAVSHRGRVASRREQWLGGAPRCGMPSRAPRRGAAARWGHRALPQRDRTTGHEGCARRWDRTTEHAGYARGAGAISGTVSDRLHGTRWVRAGRGGARRAAARGATRGAKVLRRQFCGGVSYSRRLRDGFPSPLNPKSFSFF